MSDQNKVENRKCQGRNEIEREKNIDKILIKGRNTL